MSLKRAENLSSRGTGLEAAIESIRLWAIRRCRHCGQDLSDGEGRLSNAAGQRLIRGSKVSRKNDLDFPFFT
jgi:hypothetical protein